MSPGALLLNIEQERFVPALQQAARSLDGSREAVLDFSSVQRIDSRGVRALEELARVANEKTVKIELRGVNIDVYKVLKLVKLTQKFSSINGA